MAQVVTMEGNGQSVFQVKIVHNGQGRCASSQKYNFAAITETWLKEELEWQLNIPGHRCFREG